MTSLTYYFDPLCPFSWVTSLWIREARRHTDIDVEWKFFSLAAINEGDVNGVMTVPLRTATLARREGGNEAVDLVYLAFGRLLHEQRVRPESLEEAAEAARGALEEVGLDPSLTARAIQDESTLQEVLQEHEESVEKLGAFGVPWLVIEGQEPGYFGPVINEVPEQDQAVELWDHFKWFATQPYLFELKRSRIALPDLKGLSARFGVPTPATT
jgi:2-hydroxychromene-2-carboxylate isomerase